MREERWEKNKRRKTGICLGPEVRCLPVSSGESRKVRYTERRKVKNVRRNVDKETD